MKRRNRSVEIPRNKSAPSGHEWRPRRGTRLFRRPGVARSVFGSQDPSLSIVRDMSARDGREEMRYRGQCTCLVQAASAGRNIVGEFDLFRQAVTCHGYSRCVRADVWNVKLLIQAGLAAVHAEGSEGWPHRLATSRRPQERRE